MQSAEPKIATPYLSCTAANTAAAARRYLNGLQTRVADWEAAGFDVVVVSADPESKAQQDVAEFGWKFDLGYGLTEDQMQKLGVYISDPLSPDETDRRFAEPAVFCVRPDGVNPESFACPMAQPHDPTSTNY